MGRNRRLHNLRRRARNQIERLFRVDGGCCHWCECALSLDLYQDEIPYATIDHVYPLSLGGDSNPTNLVISCAECNRWRNIAWQSYGLLLYASHRVIQSELSGRKKVAGDKQICRASIKHTSKYHATLAMHRKVLEKSVPKSIALQFKVYQCEQCNFWHWRKFPDNNSNGS